MACGDGLVGVFLALHGAKVIGFDKRQDAIAQASALAVRLKVQTRCMFLGACSEQMPIGTNTADIVFSRSTLQYTDRARVIAECLRILKPGGALLLNENLPYNPLVNLYRWEQRLTARRKEDIQYVKSIRGYLTFREINALRGSFATLERREYHLLRMLTFGLRRRFAGSSVIRLLDDKLAALDGFLLAYVPMTRYFGWVVAVAGKGKIGV
jgi:ubiquinone/menaquinone biosynthesis C-methylase UbiE